METYRGRFFSVCLLRRCRELYPVFLWPSVRNLPYVSYPDVVATLSRQGLLRRGLTLKRPGGGLNQPPLDIFCDHSAARNFLTAPLADFLLSSLAHLMTPFSRKSGIPLRRCTTFYTSSSDQKWLKNVILCTKSMQMEFSHLIHKDMIIFTFIGWNQFILA